MATERVYRTEKQKLALVQKFMRLTERGARGKFLVEKGIPMSSMYAWAKKWGSRKVMT